MPGERLGGARLSRADPNGLEAAPHPSPTRDTLTQAPEDCLLPPGPPHPRVTIQPWTQVGPGGAIGEQVGLDGGGHVCSRNVISGSGTGSCPPPS